MDAESHVPFPTPQIALSTLNPRVVDVLVQSYAPQPNLLFRTVSVADLLPPVTSAHLASLAEKLNEWDFHAGLLDEEDLIWSSVLILEHVLNTGAEELSPYKISRGTLNIAQ